jgi:RHS repeat-associated protein
VGDAPTRPAVVLLALLLTLAGLPSARPTTVTSTVDATEVLELGYTYDPVGNLATYSDTGGTASFTYDDLDRLTAADYPGGSDFAYSYDTVGNVTAITTPAGTLAFSYDLADRITSAGPGPAPAAPAYDANGNLTSDGSYGGRTYAYDPLGRLVGVSGGGHSASHTLDGAGNRLAQTVDTVTTGFDLDLSIPDSTVLSDGTRTYLPGDPGAGSLSGGVWTSMLTDQLGTGLLTVTGGGSVGTPRQVGPYGLDRDGSVLAPGIGYTGEWSDATGLVNLRARAYDPLLARFLGRDTFGGVASAPQTANRYSYAANNPFRYTDPSGRFIQAALDHPGELASLAVSLTVVPGLALAAWAAVTGSDPFTGRLLSGEEAAAGLLFAGLGPFGKLLGAARGAATAALGRFDDIFGRFVHAMRDLPGRGLETLRGLRTRGLGWLGDLGAGLRARFGAIGRGGGASVGPATVGVAGGRDGVVYRALRESEVADVVAGRGISRPSGLTTATQHILGANSASTPWVSTTRSRETAEFYASHGGALDTPLPVIEIDLSKVTYPVLDVSTRSLAEGGLRHPRAIAYASAHEEILVRGGLNPEAILGIVSGG